MDIDSGRIDVPADTAAASEAAFNDSMQHTLIGAVDADYAGNHRISGAISRRRADNGQ